MLQYFVFNFFLMYMWLNGRQFRNNFMQLYVVIDLCQKKKKITVSLMYIMNYDYKYFFIYFPNWK